MTKLFTIAGTSTLNGLNTYRFATGKLNVRVAKLKRHDHSDISLVELPSPMSKVDAIAWLNARGVTAAIPVTGRKANVELTDEQKAAKQQREQAIADAAAAAAVAAAAVAAADEQYLQNLGSNDAAAAAEDPQHSDDAAAVAEIVALSESAEAVPA